MFKNNYKQSTTTPSKIPKIRLVKYKCSFCSREWESVTTTITDYQICKGCYRKCNPVSYRYKIPDHVSKSIVPHNPRLCGKCIRLGSSCIMKGVDNDNRNGIEENRGLKYGKLSSNRVKLHMKPQQLVDLGDENIVKKGTDRGNKFEPSRILDEDKLIFGISDSTNENVVNDERIYDFLTDIVANYRKNDNEDINNSINIDIDLIDLNDTNINNNEVEDLIDFNECTTYAIGKTGCRYK